MMINIITICSDGNQKDAQKRREGEGQKVMIEIIISENDDK